MAFRDLYIEGKNVIPVVKALSSDIRLEILGLLEDGELNIQSIAKRLGLSKTNILTHINILEEAGFIKTRYVPGTVGNQKMCSKVYDRLIFNFSRKSRSDANQYREYFIPVGNYFDFSIYPPCGLASRENVIKKWDDPEVFYDIERVKADLVWGSHGFVEYRIPLPEDLIIERTIKIELILEVSALGDLVEHKALRLPEGMDKSNLTEGISDITFWVNGLEAGTVTVEEYSRGTGGRFTPTWWKGSSYGKQITLVLTQDHTSINGAKQTNRGLSDFNLGGSLKFRAGIKDEALHKSGFNIYGNHFGNHGTDIVLRIYDAPLQDA